MFPRVGEGVVPSREHVWKKNVDCHINDGPVFENRLNVSVYDIKHIANAKKVAKTTASLPSTVYDHLSVSMSTDIKKVIGSNTGENKIR